MRERIGSWPTRPGLEKRDVKTVTDGIRRMQREVGKARGMLRAQPTGGAFHHVRIAPVEALEDIVPHFWFIRWDLSGHAPQTRESLPHPNMHMVLERGSARIWGVHTARFVRVLEGRDWAFGVKFRAGGFRPFLDRPASTVTEGSLSWHDVFGRDADALASSIIACDDEHAMIDVATRFLSSHRAAPDGNTDTIAHIVADIADDRAILRVDQIVDRHDIGKRALQRLFNEYVGVSPKWVINRYRLHEAIERLADGVDVDWTELALDLGYFDQAHFIRDFRQLVGRTPGEYVRNGAAASG
jgi:AraC-like DNA-binding protein